METPIFELWVDHRKSDRRSGLEGLLDDRGIQKYVCGNIKHVFDDTPSSSLPKIFFLNILLSNELCADKTDPEDKIKLLQENESVFHWCNKHGIQCYIDRSWEIMDMSPDGSTAESTKQQAWWKFLQNYNIKILCLSLIHI